MDAKLEFVAVIQETESSEFVLRFPDLPGFSVVAASEQEARDLAAEALADHIETLRLAGEAIPNPSTFTAILADAKWRAGRSTRVRAAQRS